jgi:hypothetical protein
VGTPAVSSRSAGQLDLFARGLDNKLHHKFFESATGWSPWESLDGALASDPTAISWGPDRIDVFIRTADSPHQIAQKTFETSKGWSDWKLLGGEPLGSPAICSPAPGRLHLFMRRVDDSLWHREYNGNWSNWESLGGAITADPGAVVWRWGK